MKLTHDFILNTKTIEVYELIISLKEKKWAVEDLQKLKSLFLPISLPWSTEIEVILEQELDPEDYGWKRTESPRLEWISKVIACYLLYKKISINILIKFLKAINYMGLFVVLEIFDEFDISSFSIKEQFDYLKSLAKHYKGKGELKKAQEYYRKAIIVVSNSKNHELLPYSLVLLAKLYSDYWQRKGLYLAFNEIAYKRAKSFIRKKNTISRWAQICADSYAKELYPSNPRISEQIFKSLLKKDYGNRDVENRIAFRNLECRIHEYIRRGKFRELTRVLRKYEELLTKIENNPKASYIRKVQILAIYRKIDAIPDKPTNIPYIINRIKELQNEEAIRALEEAIANSRTFNDHKFLVLAYFEKSFWIKALPGEALRSLGEKIKCLEESYKYFSVSDKSSIINRTYINVIEQLARLHVQQRKWDKALYYYNKLYDYLDFLTETLEGDRGVIDKFILNSKWDTENHYPEFKCLTKKELRKVKESLITDYKELTHRLMSYGEKIKNIQKLHFDYFSEVLLHSGHQLTHDLSQNVTNIQHALNRIYNNYTSHNISPDIKATFKAARNETKKAISNIKGYEKLTIDEIISAKEIELVKEISSYVTFANAHTGDNVLIIFQQENDNIYGELMSFLINRLLDNLVENCIHVGQRNQISRIIIEIKIAIRNGHVYLDVTDNCEDFDFYQQTIENLNQNATIYSTKNANGKGNGLSKIKRLINIKMNWELTPGSGKHVHLKTLKIPLCECR